MTGCLPWKPRRARRKKYRSEKETRKSGESSHDQNNSPKEENQPEDEELADNLKQIRIQREEKVKDLHICDLKENHYDKLCSKLDAECVGIFNWEDLAESLIEDKDKCKTIISDIQIHWNGSGNPAFFFIGHLQRTTEGLTIEKFKNTAEKLKRPDIVTYIDEHFSGIQLYKKICEISLEEKLHLARKLRDSSNGVKDWRHFADEYQLSPEEKSLLKLKRNGNRDYSPTRMLFDEFNALRITKLKLIQEKCDRNDVKNCFNEIFQEEQNMDLQICDLKENHYDKLCSMLDIECVSIFNWEDLAESLFEDKDKCRTIISDIQIQSIGSGNPAFFFIGHIQRTMENVTIKEFKNTAEKLNRPDIVTYMDKHFSDVQLNKKICEISLEEKLHLARKLHDSSNGVNDWRYFADEYQLSSEEKSLLKLKRNGNRDYSPTRMLFDEFHALRITKLKLIQEKCDRNDVKNCFNEIFQELITTLNC